MTIPLGPRGSGRTTRSLEQLLKVVLEGPEPRLGVYVTTGKQMDDYCFRIIAHKTKDLIKQYSMTSRMITFTNGGRIRFISWDDNLLVPYDEKRWLWLVQGYRQDTPVFWDHHAVDCWTERQMSRNRPIGRPERKH